jgi:cation:H+ antiporter
VKGSVGLAERLGVAPIVVGLTVVAFGTSMPELVVNISAGVRGNSGIGFGNVVGSNIANIGLLIGVSALIAPLAIHRVIVMREIPMMILACLAALALGGGGFLGAEQAGYTRGDGVMLLLLFGVFLYYTVTEALLQSRAGRADGDFPPTSRLGRGQIAILIVGGLGALVLGGELTVAGATNIARSLGIADTVISLTIVAVGTSLPELATTLTAARAGQGDLAIGNIVGSNIFNLLLIWGISVLVAPTAIPAGGMKDLLVMTGISLILLPMAFSQHRIARLEGGVILAIYVGYIGTLVVTALR